MSKLSVLKCTVNCFFHQVKQMKIVISFFYCKNSHKKIDLFLPNRLKVIRANKCFLFFFFFFQDKYKLRTLPSFLPSEALRHARLLICMFPRLTSFEQPQKRASLAGCLQAVMWPEAVAPLCTKARIRAGGEAYHEPLLCLDWKGSSSFAPGLFTEASLPQFVGIVPVRTAETKSSFLSARNPSSHHGFK